MYEDEEIEDARLVKDLRAQIKALGKERDEATKERDALKGSVRQTSVADLLGSKGVNKALAKFAIADGVEDEAGVTAWLAENGELFGAKPADAAPVEDEDEMKRVQDATSSGAKTALSSVFQQDADAAQTPEEWKAAILAARAGEPV